MAVSHLAFDLGLWHQSRHRIDNDDIKRARTNQHVCNLKSLFAVVRLRNDKRISVHAKFASIGRIERVLGVNVCGHATLLLGIGHHMQGKRGFTGRFGTIDFHDAALRQAANAQRHVERERTGRDYFDILHGLIAEAHGRALAEAFFDLRQSSVQRRLALGIELVLGLGCRILGRLGLKCHDLLLIEVVCG